MADDVTDEISRSCLATRTRRISRVLTGVYDEKLRPFGINSPQFTLLAVISRLGAATRADIGRANHQERSTLTRNLQLMLSAGWIKEVQTADGPNRQIALTATGRNLLHRAAPAWRAAQAQAKTILGESGVAAVIDIAKGLPPQTA
jgi:DNA-binding MarR family transcriptional regulator